MSWIEIATWMVRGLGFYAALGVLFGAVFVTRGLERLDPGTRGSGWGFRLIVFPGVVALWPLLLRRWLAGSGLPVESNAHRRAAQPGEGALR